MRNYFLVTGQMDGYGQLHWFRLESMAVKYMELAQEKTWCYDLELHTIPAMALDVDFEDTNYNTCKNCETFGQEVAADLMSCAECSGDN